MIIQHNLTAMNANRMIGLTKTRKAKTTEKPSSACWLANVSTIFEILELASLIAATPSISASLTYVDGSMLSPVLEGTLYAMIGTSLTLAYSLKSFTRPFCVALL